MLVFLSAPLRVFNISNTWLTYIKAKFVRFIKCIFLSSAKLNKTEIFIASNLLSNYQHLEYKRHQQYIERTLISSNHNKEKVVKKSN